MSKVNAAQQNASKNAIQTLTTNMMQEIDTKLWNNIPIPICEAIDQIVNTFKKLGLQVDHQLEQLRRTHTRFEQDNHKESENLKESLTRRFDNLTRSH